MGEKLIKPYEISVWEEKLTQIEGSEPAEYTFKETKLAVIGSNTMTGPNKVYEPVFTKKVNGEKTLTFSLKYRYFDPYSENEEVVNPFAALLVNERKVKLHYDGQWYEFIVKDHTESSDELTWTYTCTDAFVLELSKNGYNIEFSSDLNNNHGTAVELARAALENTEWQVGDSNPFKQYVEDPIYNATIKSIQGIEIINAEDGSAASIQADTNIYLFYSYVQNKSGKDVQFILKDDEAEYTIDDKNVITATNYRIKTELTYKDYFTVENPSGNPQEHQWYELQGSQYVLSNDVEIQEGKTYYYLHRSFWLGETEVISIDDVDRLFQANRLNYAQKTTYDPIMGQTVNIYKVGDREVYQYSEDIYTTSNVVQNFIANGDNFNALEDGSLQGWNPYVESVDDKAIQKLELVTYPELEYGKKLVDLDKLSSIDGYLKVRFMGELTDGHLNTIHNEGFNSNLSVIGPISQGDKFVFRWRAGRGELGQLQPVDSLGIMVAKYTRDTPGWGRYYYHVDPSDIILQTSGTVDTLNSKIEGGILSEDYKTYKIDNVVQAPSTKYLYRNEDSFYYWDGAESVFKLHSTIVNGEEIVDPNSTFLPYYYVIAKANKALTQSVLDDPTTKYGFFIYTTVKEDAPIYLRDVQFTRCIYDADKKPIIMGNIPTATVSPTEHWYFKPSEGTAAEDVETYSSIKELENLIGEPGSVTPVYNDEKNLMISVSQSNCFNILQTIAETFECWVDLVVGHDDNGAITFHNGKPDKYVYLREYVGKDNYTGFKYGINLNSIERNVNSDEIVTKLIVDDSQSEYVDEGFVSIGNAPSNPSGEHYIINFNYYYNQGLLDRETTEKDRSTFVEHIKEMNNQLQALETERRNLEAAMTSLGSNRNVFTELIDSAQDAKTQAIEDFQTLTKRTYEEYKDWYNKSLDDGADSESDQTGATQEAPQTEEETDSLLEEENVMEVLGKLYTSSAVINNYEGVLSNVNTEYWTVRKQLKGSESHAVEIWTGTDEHDQTHLFVELDDYWPGVSFVKDGDTANPYKFTISNKYFDITIGNDTTQWTLEFDVPDKYTIETNPCTVTAGDTKTIKILASGEEITGVEKQIDNLLEEKKDYVNKFNNKYIRYITEGTWNSTDYIDSELYYLDALQVSNTSAQPAVTYTINVVEVSQLEGLGDYLFDAGDKTYVEDTEFFGWSNKHNVLTPAREEVIVSEVEWHLDEPENNVITVQNYKTRFEDLFQRISAAVQTVQYNEATYAKISTLMDANGTINQDVLLKSINQIAGKQYNLTSDGSVLIDEDRILVRNLHDSQNLVIINSKGIRISADGGQNWRTAIDGQGINIGTVYTGMLNTNNVVIGNRDNPSFRWDKNGINAYREDGTTVDAEGHTIPAYDLGTFVRYDQNGLYGIKNGNSYQPYTLDEVKDKAHFAVTWDGFFIKNSYPGGGRVEITSDNDFRVMNIPEGKTEEQEKIKIGALEWGDGITSPDAPGATEAPTLYGIRIKNDAGAEVMKTDDKGNITISGTINANAGNIGGMSVDNDRLRMDHIVFEPGTGIYSDWGDTSSYPFIISDEDGSATFNNVVVRGAIKTSVFEYEEIQAVGGAFMFRPSTTIKTAIKDGDDLLITVEKSLILRDGAWYKLSNYNGGTAVDAEDLTTYGLTHIYQLSKEAIRDENEVVTSYTLKLLGAGANDVLDVIGIDNIPGGSIIDMGYESNHSSYNEGKNNYGIGINSSDNYINLPPRAISLFETVVNHNNTPKVTYNYRGILGTLPDERLNNIDVSNSIYPYMRGTQGIYTDNMYLGDSNQYIAFYEDERGKQLKIKANQIMFEITDDQGQGTGEYKDVTEATEGADGEDAITVRVDSSAGNVFLNKHIQTTLTCTVIKGNGTDITNQVTRFTWIKQNADGTVDSSWSRPLAGRSITLTDADVNSKAIFVCEVEF